MVLPHSSRALIPATVFTGRSPRRRVETHLKGSSYANAGRRFISSTITSPTTETIDWMTDIVLVASPIVMPKASFTSQNPAWFA